MRITLRVKLPVLGRKALPISAEARVEDFPTVQVEHVDTLLQLNRSLVSFDANIPVGVTVHEAAVTTLTPPEPWPAAGSLTHLDGKL